MNVAQHAEKILAAWNVADPVTFEFELENALDCCRRATPAGHFELEQQEVLESVVVRLRSMGARGSQRRGLHAVIGDPARQNYSECDRSEHGGFEYDLSGQSGTLHAGFALLEHLRQRAVA